MYIPKSVEGDKLDAAKKFIAFAATQPGCDAFAKGRRRQGPYLTKACKLPSDVTQVAKDTKSYIESGKASPALEFLSPIKGPSLEQICIQVGTGQVERQKGAACTTRTSRSRRSSWVCPVGADLRASRGCSHW